MIITERFFADTVLDYLNSGTGSYPVPYGYIDPDLRDGFNGEPIPVNLDVVLGDDPAPGVSSLSLPTGSYVTVGFNKGFAIDGPGNDFFIRTDGLAAEKADVFVSSLANPTAADFTFLGQIQDGAQNTLDLATIRLKDPVRAIKIVGLDNGGLSAGFDVINVQLLQISTTVGNRILTGGNQNDVMRGGRGNDVLKGGDGSDQLIGDAGQDILLGGNGGDRLTDSAGQNYFEGGAGRDSIVCGRGRDIIAPDFANRNTADIVQEFRDRQDKLSLAPDVKFRDLDFRQTAQGIVLLFQNRSIMTLAGIQRRQIKRADFVSTSEEELLQSAEVF